MLVQSLAYFVDIDTFYGLNNNDILITNLKAINNQINNILTTTVGERWGDVNDEPFFGSNIPELLFEPIDDYTAWRLETATFRAINRWMSTRIIMDPRQTRVFPIPNQQSYQATLVYRVITENINARYKVLLSR